MEVKTAVLDHGYVALVESWGSDERIVEAARMSTDKGFQGWGPTTCDKCVEGVYHDIPAGPLHEQFIQCPYCKGKFDEVKGDEKLLRYLWTHHHTTPFEMAGLSVEVQAPIFVFREWHRHRTQSYNELSARYTALPDLFYVPSVARLMAATQSTTNKQASADGFTRDAALEIRVKLADSYVAARHAYEAMLAGGVAREVSRLVIPVAQYSRMRASANLRNWLHFLTLRMDAGAQWEIRQYANAVGAMVAERFPRTWTLFDEGRTR